MMRVIGNPSRNFYPPGTRTGEYIKVEDSPLDLLKWQLLPIWSQWRLA